MNGLFQTVPLFEEIARHINNTFNRYNIKLILKKMAKSSSFRLKKTEEMYFVIGKIVSINYESIYCNLRQKIINCKTDKFQIKGVFDIDNDSYLLVVLCNDQVLESRTESYNLVLAKFTRIRYFKVQKNKNESKIEFCTQIYDDLSEKNLLLDFFYDVKKYYKL